jgi:O-antigen/teichoic acid export membrane protein
MCSTGLTSLSERTLQDASKLMGAQVVVSAVSVFFSAWLIRKVPPEQLALWPIAIGLGSVVASIGSFGMGDFLVRVIPNLLARGQREEASAVLKTALVLNFLGCIAATILLYVAARPVAQVFLHDKNSESLVRTLVGAILFLALRERIGWALSAVQEFGKIGFLKVFVDVGRMPIMVFSFLAYGINGLLVGMMFVPMVATFLSIFWLWRYASESRRFASPLRMVADAIPYYGVSMLALASGQAQYLLVGMLTTPVALASYFVADKVAGYVEYFGRFAVDAVGPKLAQKGALDLREAEKAITKCTRYVFLGLLPLHVGVAILSRPLIRLYAGAQYTEAAIILAILAIAYFLKVLLSLYEAGVRVWGRPWHLLVVSLTHVAVNITALLLLVSRWAATGAALTLLVDWSFMACFSAFLLSRTVVVRHDNDALLRALWATTAMALVVGGVQGLFPDLNHKSILLLGGFWGTIAYVAALSQQLSEADVRILHGLLPRRLRESAAGQVLRAWLVRVFAPRGAAAVRSQTGTGTQS